MLIGKEREGIEKKFFDLCEKVVSDNDLSLYDLEYLPGSHTLRVYIMNEATNSAELDDCVKIDRALTPFIDGESWMPSTLTLEVSSPGIYRNLKTMDHFLKVKGEKIALVTNKSIDQLVETNVRKLKGQKKAILKLEEVKESALVLSYEDEKLEINFENIKKANLETDV